MLITYTLKKVVTMKNYITPEFSRQFCLEKVSNTPISYHINATFDECQALANRFNIVSIEQIKGDFKIHRGNKKTFEIDGHIHAELTQECIVSLEAINSSLSFPIRLILKNYSSDDIDETNFDLELDMAEKDIDYLEGQTVFDLGEITAQYLSLALNPYPRSSSSFNLENNMEKASESSNDSIKNQNPFKKLENFQKK